MPLPTPTHTNWPPARIKLGKNSRQITVDDGIRELHQSILKNGLLQPLGVIDRADDNLIFGFRRFTAIGLGGIDSIPVSVYPASTTVTQVRGLNAVENLQRVDLTEPQIYRLCKELMGLNPDWKRQDLAATLSKDASTVTRYLSPDDLIPEALAAFMDGRFGFSKAYAISKSPDQKVTLDLTLSGKTRDEVEAHSRNGHQKNEPEEDNGDKPTTVKIALPGNVVIAINGIGLTLPIIVQRLLEAHKEAGKGKDQGWNAKTFANVMRDRSKKPKADSVKGTP